MTERDRTEQFSAPGAAACDMRIAEAMWLIATGLD